MRHEARDTGHGTRDTGHETRDTRHGTRDMGHGTKVIPRPKCIVGITSKLKSNLDTVK
jgi:hypothetical protein